jgi:hypothetical protein
MSKINISTFLLATGYAEQTRTATHSVNFESDQILALSLTYSHFYTLYTYKYYFKQITSEVLAKYEDEVCRCKYPRILKW